MANRNKKVKEPIYRDDYKNERWRFLSTWGEDRWMMVRVKDGHRLIFKPENLKLENTPS